MKQTYLLLLAFFAIQTTHAQIIDIPDANFKNALIDANTDTNGDGEIQVSEAEAVTNLIVYGKDIQSLQGIESFINLERLNCHSNQLTSLDITSLLNLEWLNCQGNNLSTLVLGNNNSLRTLYCWNNQISSLNLVGLNDLRSLNCTNNQLNTLNISNNILLNSLGCSDNLLTELDIENNNALTTLNVSDNQITALHPNGLQNLQSLYCENNLLTNLDLPENNKLWYFSCANNQLTSLDLTFQNLIFDINCSNNQLTELEIGDKYRLGALYCSNNQITTLDISESPAISNFDCSNNQLINLNIKNGALNRAAPINPFESTVFNFSENPNIKYICADDIAIQYVPYPETYYVQNLLDTYGYTNCVVNSYCSFVPGGEFYLIEGNTKIDLNSDGCDTNDGTYSNLKFNITDGTTSGSIISDNSGDYTIPVQEGTHTITPILGNLTYFTITPTDYTVSFPTETSPYTQNFCITPNGTYNDLEVTILPLEAARPGFDTNYKITYKNKGTTTLSGTVEFMFQDDVMDLVSANPIVDIQSVNNLSWNYNSLAPFESGEILLTMNLNTPTETPALNGEDVLVFTATANPTTGDETPEDNVFTLNQTVVNSYDPNDKTCLEGSTITPELIGEFVHYLIRFENTGTADAINVVVKDVIDDAKFDVSSLFLSDASHELVTKITGNTIEFIFENINLPFDDANNDGYIAFKIKTLPTLVTGDTFENDAEIYFDYNFPIDTNVAQTIVEQTLSITTLESLEVSVYPNPTQDVLNINAKDIIESITIYDLSGRLINQIALIGNTNKTNINTDELTAGTYFIKVKTEAGEGVEKIIKD